MSKPNPSPEAVRAAQQALERMNGWDPDYGLSPPSPQELMLAEAFDAIREEERQRHIKAHINGTCETGRDLPAPTPPQERMQATLLEIARMPCLADLLGEGGDYCGCASCQAKVALAPGEPGALRETPMAMCSDCGKDFPAASMYPATPADDAVPVCWGCGPGRAPQPDTAEKER